jgi:hypothetical protein
MNFLMGNIMLGGGREVVFTHLFLFNRLILMPVYIVILKMWLYQKGVG